MPATATRDFFIRQRDRLGVSVWAGLIAAGILTAQTPTNAPSAARKVSFYHKEGNRNVAHITASEATPQGGSLLLARNFRMETFREKDGSEELVAEAPECLFDMTTKLASSPGPIQVRHADGLFFLEGRGFRWDQESSRLIVSNHVHTVIQIAFFNPRSP
ncbi:MAG: hypothetical protein EXS36_02095 [Pedosphaera sp.]|nr:hypothetical protein [Pedosphaera sp.]